MFASVSSNVLEKLIEQKDCENTKNSTKSAVKIFRDYLFEKKLDISFEHVSKPVLGNILGNFYVEARNKQGQVFHKNTVEFIRAGLACYLLTIGEQYDIINDEDFSESNKLFHAQGVFLKKSGKAKVKHHPVINDEYLAKLNNNLCAQITPQLVCSRRCFLTLCYIIICRRSRENLHELKILDFKIDTDGSGAKFVHQTRDKLTKTPSG